MDQPNKIIVLASVSDGHGQMVSVVGEFTQTTPWTKMDLLEPDPKPYGLPMHVHSFQCYDSLGGIYSWSPYSYDKSEEISWPTQSKPNPQEKS